MSNLEHTPAGTPWFAISVGLVGLIVGYGLSTAMAGGGSFSEGDVGSIIQVYRDLAAFC